MSMKDDADTTAVYAYSLTVNGKQNCLMDAEYPKSMANEINTDQFLFDTIQACCEAYEYTCTAEPTEAPVDAPTKEQLMATVALMESYATLLSETASREELLHGKPEHGKLEHVQPAYVGSKSSKPHPSESDLTADPIIDSPVIPEDDLDIAEDIVPAETITTEDVKMITTEDVNTTDPTQLPNVSNANSTSSIYSYDIIQHTTSYAVAEDSVQPPVEYFFLIVPLVVLVVASMFYRRKRRRESEAESEEASTNHYRANVTMRDICLQTVESHIYLSMI